MTFNRLVFTFAAVVCILPFAARHAFASDKDDIVATIHQFADNLDPKTIDKALATCDSQTSIIDEFPPHLWNSCADWVKAFGEYNDKNGVTDTVAKIGAPWSVDVEGDRAYAVSPATYTYKQQGKLNKELHAVFTAAFRKTENGWRITAWSWSKH
ncbi:MAG TPA: nuclear transport factor 2 family protein [Terriglobales bacterium]|nr:nuclear transport factor 2 family protein [Terriglobales bacterium]